MNPTGEGNWNWNWVTQLDTHTDTDTRYALYFYHISSSFFLNSIFLFNHRTPLSFLFCTCLSPTLRPYLSLSVSPHTKRMLSPNLLSPKPSTYSTYVLYTTPSSPLSKSKQLPIPNPTYPTIGWMGLTSPWTSFACFCAYPNNIIVQGNRMVEISHSLCLVPLSLSSASPSSRPRQTFPFPFVSVVGSVFVHLPLRIIPFNFPSINRAQIRRLNLQCKSVTYVLSPKQSRSSPCSVIIASLHPSSLPFSTDSVNVTHNRFSPSPRQSWPFRLSRHYNLRASFRDVAFTSPVHLSNNTPRNNNIAQTTVHSLVTHPPHTYLDVILSPSSLDSLSLSQLKSKNSPRPCLSLYKRDKEERTRDEMLDEEPPDDD